jgi:hypothetical protein
MAPQRIFHWKHGWIPLDHYAALEKGNGRASTGKLHSSYTPSIEDIRNLLQPQYMQQDPADVDFRDSSLFSDMDNVNGVEFRTFKDESLDPGDGAAKPHKFTAGQKKEIAAVLNDLYRKFPQAKPITIVGTENPSDHGTTEWSGNRISLSSMLFSPASIKESRASFGPNGLIGAGSRTNAQFRRAVIVHEFGHALEMQQGDVSREAGGNIANEVITPADLGIKLPPDSPPMYAPRWKADTLKAQSAYATGNEYEWFAEAFTDGLLNGEMASPSGQRVLALTQRLYGGKAAS